MSKFEILCVTMNQHDFSKLQEMNVHSNIVYANQSDYTAYEEYSFEGKTAKMISTQTRGVGINRNFALSYANAEICMMADDDVVYYDDMEEKILAEFERHPDADIIIFHLATDNPAKKQVTYKKTRKCTPWEKMPWGTFRVAFRLAPVRKANLWFTTLFGGGCIFPSGEDSMWLSDARKAGLTFYVSDKTIGTVSFDQSTWFTGYDEKYFFGKGIYYQAVRSRGIYMWMLYFSLREKRGTLTWKQKIQWMQYGRRAYREMLSYKDYCRKYNL